MAQPSTDPPAGPATTRAAVIFALLALASSWNAFAAPFGLLVGVAAALLGLRGRRRGARAGALWAVGLGSVAALASGAVLFTSAGAVTADLIGDPVVKGRSPAEVAELLEQAAKATEPARMRADAELGSGAAAGPEDGGAKAPGSARNSAGLHPSPRADGAGEKNEPE